MDGAEAIALLDSELRALLILGQSLTRRRNPSIVDLRTFREQLGKTMTAVTEVGRWASPDLESRLQVFLRVSEEAHRTLYPVRIQAAAEVRRLINYAQSMRDELAANPIRYSSAPLVPISTGNSPASAPTSTPIAGAPSSTFAQADDPTATPATPLYEPRYLVAQSPSIVGLRTTFTVRARIDIQPAEGSSAALEPMNIPKDGLAVNLRAVLTGDGLEMSGVEFHQVRIFAGTVSDEVAFQFKALRKGPARVALRAYVDQAFRGELALELEVADKGVPEQQESTAEIAARKPPSRQATLEIEYQAASNSYRYVMRGPNNIGTYIYHKQMTAAPTAFVSGLMAQINDAAKNRGGQDKTVIEAQLIGIGKDLWDQLLPADLQAKLVSHWDDVDRLELMCGEEPLPWELLYCPDRDEFMADHWLVFRWMYGAPAPFAVGTGPACYVIASPPLPNAEKEVQAARAIYPSDEIWTRVDQLIAGLKKAEIGLLHFAAHNLISYTNAGASAVQLDGPYSQVMLAAQKKGSLNLRPLVFLNACSSAAAAQQFVGCSSWAGRFLGAGAGAFIGSMWEIRDLSAAQFSDAFYRHTQNGSSLGEAFSQARATLSGSDPTRFAYTFFGDPDAALSVKEN